MLEFHDPIPDVTGQKCAALVAQRYWYRGELVADSIVLFLKLREGVWHRFFIDAGVVFWKLVDSPDPPGEEGDHRWTLIDVSAAHGLVGRELTRISTADLPGGGELRLEFHGGPALILRNTDDQSQLVVEA